VSVIIAISSDHRKEALEAVHFCIDELKASVEIWKREYYGDAGTYDGHVNGGGSCDSSDINNNNNNNNNNSNSNSNSNSSSNSDNNNNYNSSSSSSGGGGGPVIAVWKENKESFDRWVKLFI
jgi:hypothetical protein